MTYTKNSGFESLRQQRPLSCIGIVILIKCMCFRDIFFPFNSFSLNRIKLSIFLSTKNNCRERTTIMSILNGLGFIVFPLAEFASGQIYKVGGYYAVYATSLAATLGGIVYIFFIPESVTKTTKQDSENVTTNNLGVFGNILNFISTGNKVLYQAMQ